jgi:integrase
MAKVNQRTWKIPGRRTKRKAWGFTVAVDGKRQKHYKAEWTQDAAEKALAELLLKIEQPEPKGAGLTLGQAAARYLAGKARKRSLEADRRYMELFKSALGSDTPLAEITASRISDWKAERLSAVCKHTKQGYSAAGINRPLAALRHLLRLAHDEWEMLPSVPRIKLEREPQGRLRWLTQEEIMALLAACLKSKNRELHPAVVIAINTGLRRSELLGLTWERVDLSRGVLRLEITKSGKRREVPLNEDSYGALVTLEPKAAGPAFRTRSIRTAFENAVVTAKLDDVSFHTLRHTFASWAMMRGVSLKELQELLGHSSLAMTMRYAHLAPEHLRAAVSRLEGLTSDATENRAQARAHEPLASVVVSEGVSEVPVS